MPQLDNKLNGGRLVMGSLGQTGWGGGERVRSVCESASGLWASEAAPVCPQARGWERCVHTGSQHQTGNLLSVKLGNDK